ncbi:MAG: TlyA family RNA methyltransferase, partial [Clostridium sp.]|nr:TlyA family RNA methyltransferase [Clostridium sp.]
LQKGAAKVYSIDVGHGQLDWRLRNDERVVCMEKTNFRFMEPKDIAEQPDFASVDVSFISLTKILLPARAILKESGEIVCLIKPQFEAGREKVGKKGVVREPEIHEEVIKKIIDYADLIGFDVLNLDFSPVKGPEGNIEYLLHLRKNAEKLELTKEITESGAEEALKKIQEEKSGYSGREGIAELIKRTVAGAHTDLDRGK